MCQAKGSLVSELLDFNFLIDDWNDKISSKQAIDRVLRNPFQEDIRPPNNVWYDAPPLLHSWEHIEDDYNFSSFFRVCGLKVYEIKIKIQVFKYMDSERSQLVFVAERIWVCLSLEVFFFYA